MEERRHRQIIHGNSVLQRRGPKFSATDAAVRGFRKDLSVPVEDSIRIRSVWLNNANPVIRERGVQIRRFHPWHVAAHTIFCAHRAGSWVARRPFRTCLHNMAFKAICIIRAQIVHERAVGVMASNACNPGVFFLPAPAVLQAVGSKPHVVHSNSDQMVLDYIFPSAVAGAAKINRIHRLQQEWIQNQA